MGALLNRSRLIRFVLGVLLVVLLAWVGFQITLNLVSSYGSTAEEMSTVLPGDDLFPTAPINWKHAITIDAAPETVWPWIIQMGDTRAAFYSYMFIERVVDPTPGRYVNASQVNPAWQNPEKGLGVIQGALSIVDWEKERYLLASAPVGDATALGWTWLWHIQPTGDGRTRLNVHMHIQPPAGPDIPVMTDIIEMGAFIMERNMMSGLKVRAEGGGEPSWIEQVEIALWFTALLVGLAAAGRFVFGLLNHRSWAALLLGLAAVIVLFIFTFLQPAVWLRGIIDAVMIAGLLWAWGLFPRPAAA